MDANDNFMFAGNKQVYLAILCSMSVSFTSVKCQRFHDFPSDLLSNAILLFDVAFLCTSADIQVLVTFITLSLICLCNTVCC